MNWSMYTADRSTHLKIVSVGLAAALLITVIGIAVQKLNQQAKFAWNIAAEGQSTHAA